MTPDMLWTYGLAPDVAVHTTSRGTLLGTATSRMWLDKPDDRKIVEILSSGGGSEQEIAEHLRVSGSQANIATDCAALLYQLDRLGLLMRRVMAEGSCLASCVPLRPPGPEPLEYPPAGPFRLSPHALARADGPEISVEAPGAWAKLVIHDRTLLPLLHDLTVDRTAAEIAAATGHSEHLVLAVLALMRWSGLLDGGECREWAVHDVLFHARTRRGYGRAILGKTVAAETKPEQRSSGTARSGRRLALVPPDLTRLLADDPPYLAVAERRRSIRRQGPVPLTSQQLSEFLFRTLHQRDGHRPYPSGGACYPLNAYVAVRSCRGIEPGLHAYDPVAHGLIAVAEPGPDLDHLLAEAAGAANVESPPQVLIVLAAEYARTHDVYRDIGYSLILKEVGAIFQAAMMAAAAMGLAACPLGCGDSLLFAQLTGTNPFVEASVGELMIGSLPDN